MRFQNAPILKLFSKVSVFINVFGCFRVDDRQKRMKKFCVFKRKRRSLVGVLKKGASAKTVVEFPYSLKKKTAGRLIRCFFFKTHHDCDSHCRKHSWLLSSVDIVKKSRHKCRAKLLMSIRNDLHIDLLESENTIIPKLSFCSSAAGVLLAYLSFS